MFGLFLQMILLKFNVGKAATGKPGPVDIGVLRNGKGEVKLMFSMNVGGERLKRGAAVLAILDALRIFLSLFHGKVIGI